MKCQIPQISWHSRDPVLSIDFQPGNRNIKRLASGGTDSHVLIWYIIHQENKTVKIECASDLTRHSKSVNVVRFSPDGELLVSGDDEGAMFVWQLKEREAVDGPKDDDNVNQEDWYPLKLLKGHLEDIYDVSWSKDGKFLVSASMDNSAIIWDMVKFQKVHMFSESKGYVQGVAWDPLNSFIATIGSDRTLRVYNINSKKRVSRVQWAPWSVTTEKGSIKSRLFYDDTLQSYFRRLSFTPDGELLIVPSGILERNEVKAQNTTYIFSRHCLNKPAFSFPVFNFPSKDKYSVAVRCNPLLYKLQCQKKEADKENGPPSKPLIDLPYRMIFAVAACDSIFLYDTQQRIPIGTVSNIHYTHLTDLTWSPDGKLLMTSSTDGYCSIIVFNDGELGEEYVPEPTPAEELEEPELSKSEDPSICSSPHVSRTHTPEKIKTELEQEGEKSLSATPQVAKTTDSESTPTSEVKVNKKPKFSIKNFFMSPKAATTKNLATSDVKDHVLQTSSMSTPKSSSVFKTSEVSEAMKVNDLEDSNSVDVIFEQLSSKKSECQSELRKEVVLASDDPVKKISIPEANDGNAILSPEDLVGKANESNDPKEDDWNLELSQESIPMEIDSTLNTSENQVNEHATKSPEVKPIVLGNSDTKVTVVNHPEIKKRRVSFVTLSSKTSSSTKP